MAIPNNRVEPGEVVITQLLEELGVGIMEHRVELGVVVITVLLVEPGVAGTVECLVDIMDSHMVTLKVHLGDMVDTINHQVLVALEVA